MIATKFSSYQTKIFDWVRTGSGHAVVRATAGSGKTTTLVEIGKQLVERRTEGEMLFCCFNKSIQTELEARLPKKLLSRTFHALGLRILTDNIQGLCEKGSLGEIDTWKTHNIVQKLLEKQGIGRNHSDFGNLYLPTVELVELCKSSLSDISDDVAIAHIISTYEIVILSKYRSLMYKIVRETFVESMRQFRTDGIINFSDMIYLPTYFNLDLRKYSWILVDEAQDLNPAQFELIRRSVLDDGRIVFVGDPSQAIYGFAGASPNSMKQIKAEMNAQEFPLSICYRCPTSHIELAQEIDPSIEASETADEGILQTISDDMFSSLVVPGDLVICRTNAPLVSWCYHLISNGIPAQVKGKDIGKQLTSLIEKIFKGKTFINREVFFSSILGYFEKAVLDLAAQYDGQSYRAEAGIQRLTDQKAVIEIIYSNLKTQHPKVADLVSQVQWLFAEDTKGVCLSTVHKAKGLEADRVFILEPHLMPLFAHSDRVLQSEMAVKFVALTRSKSALYFVGEMFIDHVDCEDEPRVRAYS